jgi:hypothetical protein
MRLNFKNSTLIVLFIASLTALMVISCSHDKLPGFGIFLKDTGELVLDDSHITVFHSDTHNLELNDRGVAKWNSFQTYPDIPKLKQSLYGRDFVVKIDGLEVGQGKFWSNVSSASLDSIVILDSIFKLDSTNKTISIRSSYPGSFRGSLDENLHKQLIEYFSKINRLT